MEVISYLIAHQNFSETLDKVIDSHKPVIISHHTSGSVVMISLDDFNSMHETMYLHGSLDHAKSLLSSIAELTGGRMAKALGG